MVQHPTNTAIYPPNVLRLICLLDGEAYAQTTDKCAIRLRGCGGHLDVVTIDRGDRPVMPKGLLERTASGRIQHVAAEQLIMCTQSGALQAGCDRLTLQLGLHLNLARRRYRKEVIPPTDAVPFFAEEMTPPSHCVRPIDATALQRALGLAHHWQRLLDAQSVSSANEIADAENLDVTYVRRLLRLVLLAPDIIESLLRRQQASLEQMRTPWSSLWAEQRQQLKQRDTHV